MRNAEFELAGVSNGRSHFILIALVSAIALSIRWTIAGGDSLWLDELHTGWVVDAGLPQVAGRAADGNQNPLFFWLTWVCTQLFGHHQLSLRLVSVVAGTVVAGLAASLTWRGSKSITGAILTGLIIALDWRFVFYGTEARPYALMQMLGLLHAGVFASLVGWLPKSEPPESKYTLSQSTKWSALTLLSIALFYCHITSVWLFAAEAIGLILIGKRLIGSSTGKPGIPQPAFFKPLLLSIGAAAVGCLPGVLGVNRVLGRKENWSDLSSPASVFTEAQEPLIFWLAVPTLALLVGWLWRKLRPKNNEERPKAEPFNHRLKVFALIWGITPIAGVIAVHYLHIAPLASFRYTLIGTAAMAIFAGLVVGQPPNAMLKIVAVALIAWSSFQNNQITRQLVTRQTLPVLRHEDWDAPTEIIRSTTVDRAVYPKPLLLFANVIEDAAAATNLDARFQEYLTFPVYQLSADRFESNIGRQIFPCPTHDSPRVRNELAQQILKAGGCWLLIRGSNATVQSIVAEVERTLSEYLPADSDKTIRIEERNDDGDVVHLFSVDLR